MVLDIKNIHDVPHILVVDDDKRLRDLLLRYLHQQNTVVVTAESAKSADEILEHFIFDIAIVDVMMPVEDGISLTRRLKEIYPEMPVLMLTAKAETEHRISGLEAGVDDYLSKPFEPKELWLRIQAILRRTALTSRKNTDVRIGEYNFDLNARTLSHDDKSSISLTESETALLALLSKNMNEILDRYTLAEELGLNASERTIDVQITRLRKKIEPDPKTPRFLQTVRGKGYILRGGR